MHIDDPQIEQLSIYLKDKEHIIWDWNGTLLSDVDHAVESVNHLLIEHGLPVLGKERYKQVFGFPIISYYEELGFDFSKESFEDLSEKFNNKYMDGFKELPLVPATQTVLYNLKNQSKLQSVLSAASQWDLDAMISHYELNSVFKYVYGINDRLAASKVDRGHELIRIAGISKEKTVIVGDTLHDLEVAQELGIDVVLLAHGHQCATRLKQRHDKVIEFN